MGFNLASKVWLVIGSSANAVRISPRQMLFAWAELLQTSHLHKSDRGKRCDHRNRKNGHFSTCPCTAKNYKRQQSDCHMSNHKLLETGILSHFCSQIAWNEWLSHFWSQIAWNGQFGTHILSQIPAEGALSFRFDETKRKSFIINLKTGKGKCLEKKAHLIFCETKRKLDNSKLGSTQ